ncbi:MAG: hypothetical protein Q4B42_05645 [Oscillospiraceae bacterium]|nr:hypothetical protein [Oscillospiraceae bacterium]
MDPDKKKSVRRLVTVIILLILIPMLLRGIFLWISYQAIMDDDGTIPVSNRFEDISFTENLKLKYPRIEAFQLIEYRGRVEWAAISFYNAENIDAEDALEIFLLARQTMLAEGMSEACAERDFWELGEPLQICVETERGERKFYYKFLCGLDGEAAGAYTKWQGLRTIYLEEENEYFDKRRTGYTSFEVYLDKRGEPYKFLYRDRVFMSPESFLADFDTEPYYFDEA